MSEFWIEVYSMVNVKKISVSHLNLSAQVFLFFLILIFVVTTHFLHGSLLGYFHFYVFFSYELYQNFDSNFFNLSEY